MSDSTLWFSYNQKIFEEKIGIRGKTVNWRDKDKIWDWDKCRISAVKLDEENIRIIIRRVRKTESPEEYHKTIPFEIRCMIGFDAIDFKMGEDLYYEPPASNSEPRPPENEKNRTRRVIRFITQEDKENKSVLTDCCIWQWKEEEKEIPHKKDWLNNIDEVFKMLTGVKKGPIKKTNKFEVETDDKHIDSIVPVIYQPIMDGMKNYLRQIHCNLLKEGVIEVSLVFNDEHLRTNFLLDAVYRVFRRFRYGRTRDFESFKILLHENYPKKIDFKNIYSRSYKIDKDNQHANKITDINYYYANEKHPIVFVNTANHALAETDNNHDLWKWEYVAWDKTTPIYFGNLDRKELEGLTGIIKIP